MSTTNVWLEAQVRPAETCVTDPVQLALLRQLEASPYAAIKQLRCDFHEGVAILRGHVPTFYTRQVALTLVMKVAGVEQVDDRIVVR